MKKIFFICLFFLSGKLIHGQTNLALSQYKDKGEKYAILYYEFQVQHGNKVYFKIIYSNESPSIEDLQQKFKIETDTLDRPQTYIMLMQCFKYLNTKGYKLVSGTNVPFLGKEAMNMVPFKEYIFIKTEETEIKK